MKSDRKRRTTLWILCLIPLQIPALRTKPDLITNRNEKQFRNKKLKWKNPFKISNQIKIVLNLGNSNRNQEQ